MQGHDRFAALRMGASGRLRVVIVDDAQALLLARISAAATRHWSAKHCLQVLLLLDAAAAAAPCSPCSAAL
eukprot:1323433-Pleurochrysis_carterae.AAC.1